MVWRVWLGGAAAGPLSNVQSTSGLHTGERENERKRKGRGHGYLFNVLAGPTSDLCGDWSGLTLDSRLELLSGRDISTFQIQIWISFTKRIMP